MSANTDNNEEERPTLSRDSLAIARTVMANDRTVLSFLGTSLAFVGTALAVIKLFDFPYRTVLVVILFVIAGIVAVAGLVDHFAARYVFRRIRPDDLVDIEKSMGVHYF